MAEKMATGKQSKGIKMINEMVKYSIWELEVKPILALFKSENKNKLKVYDFNIESLIEEL